MPLATTPSSCCPEVSAPMVLEPVAVARTPYPVKFGVPRQPGLADALEATVELVAPYEDADALRGLAGFDWVWLVWGFSHNRREGWTPTVRPPRLGGTERMGVFATRSSFRPNGLGLSCVRLLAVEPAGERADGSRGPLIRVRGADMVDGTPIYDIKPYLAFCDSHPDAASGWVEERGWTELEVDIPAAEAAKVPERLREGLRQLLAQDPRPAYTRGSQDGREFWVPLENLAVRFTVQGDYLAVTSIDRLDGEQMERLRATGQI